MNGFQILDKEGNDILIKELDRQVCELTDNEVDLKYYCLLGNRKDYPEGHSGNWEYLRCTSNWYDTIGWMIASEGKSLNDIIDYYTDIMKDFLGQKDEHGNIITIEMIYPYHMKVLNHWIGLGYTAKQVKG